MLFGRKRSREEEERQTEQAGLVELLLGADVTERRRLLLIALQTGELRKSEAADLLKLVERLEAFQADEQAGHDHYASHLKPVEARTPPEDR